jgi:hypothetical protein
MAGRGELKVEYRISFCTQMQLSVFEGTEVHLQV